MIWDIFLTDDLRYISYRWFDKYYLQMIRDIFITDNLRNITYRWFKKYYLQMIWSIFFTDYFKNISYRWFKLNKNCKITGKSIKEKKKLTNELSENKLLHSYIHSETVVCQIGIKVLRQTLILYNPYIFVSWWCKHFISMVYKGCKDIGIIKS